MRIIDAERLAEKLEKLSEQTPTLRDTLRIIASGLRHDEAFAPTIDAVPVVRCKDCKHREKCNLMTDDDFCSDGERREENNG